MSPVLWREENHRDIGCMERVGYANLVHLAIVLVDNEIQNAPNNYIQIACNSLALISNLSPVGSKMIPSQRHIYGG